MATHNLVFISPDSKTTKIIELKSAFHPQRVHIQELLTSVRFNGVERFVYVWGDYMYTIGTINEPIKLYGKYYQVVELVKFGHYYVVETSDDNGETWDFLEESKSFVDYDECYNEMKKEATNYLANEIDITQDFDFQEENTHSMLITFGHDYIIYQYSRKLMRFTMRGDC